MAGKSTELMAEESRETRFQMHRLVEGGMSEQIALRNVLKDDRNRSRRLSRWKDHGLWPVPAEELAEHGQAVTEEAGPTTSHITEPTSQEPKELGEATRQLPVGRSVSSEDRPETEVTPTPPTVEASQNRDTRTTEATRHLLGHTPEDAEEVQAMIGQLLKLYRSGKLAELEQAETLETATATLPHMPKLSMKPSSVYLSVKLMELAEAKAQEDSTLPAGQTWTRSALVNYLVWQYCGCPTAQEVEGPPEE